MSTYVMSDIHGCYDEFMEMLKKIEFSDEDRLIIAGDYIDRGPDSDKMLDFICENQDNPNFVFLKGNHDVEYTGYIDFMIKNMKDKGEEIVWDSNESARKAYKITYDKCVYELDVKVFDYYYTLAELIGSKNMTFDQLMKWSKAIKKMDYYHKETIDGKDYIIVHAGYIEDIEGKDFEGDYSCLEEFYIYARDDAYIWGGAPNTTIIAGHTPTILEEEFPYNDGEVYSFYDEELNCKFYDIDCGGVYENHKSNFAAIRLEDEKIFYLNP